MIILAFIVRTFDERYNRYYYYVMVKNKKTRSNEISRPATEEEIKNYHSTHFQEDVLTTRICDSPFCEKPYKLSKAKKYQLFVTNPKRGAYEFDHCSEKCREEHLAALGGK